MTRESVSLELDPRGVATLSINRPERHNAFDDQLIARLLQALEAVEVDPNVRILLLASRGRNFSAGADLEWMRRMAGYNRAQNLQDARQLSALMDRLNSLSKPTLCRVQGAAIGGGVGLVACCDLAVASEEASFAFSEVRLGLVPAVISPYVVAAIGSRAARRYFLTAERFSASEALRLGLVSELVPAEDLDRRMQQLIDELLKGGPEALAAAKRLIHQIDGEVPDQALRELTAERIAVLRADKEGREGISAFLEKRPPAWLEGEE